MASRPCSPKSYYLLWLETDMDTQDEWVWLAGNLYYYRRMNPATAQPEYKKRYYAFDVQRPTSRSSPTCVPSAVRLIAIKHVDSLSMEYSSATFRKLLMPMLPEGLPSIRLLETTTLGRIRFIERVAPLA